MEIYLCLGDVELLRDIDMGKITNDFNLNDSQSRSARHLYNQELITAFPSVGLTETVRITILGKERLALEK